MKNLKRILDPNLNQKQIDSAMEDLLRQKFERDKISRYKRILKENYGVDRMDASILESRPSSYRIKILWILGILSLALVAFLLFSKTTKTLESQAIQYALNNPIPQINSSRNISSENDQIRGNAILAYKNENFEAAYDYYSSIVNLNNTDRFYLAYCLFRLNNYKGSLRAFEKYFESADNTSPLFAEAEVYRVLNYILIKKDSEARKYYDVLEANSWAKNQLNYILE